MCQLGALELIFSLMKLSYSSGKILIQILSVTKSMINIIIMVELTDEGRACIPVGLAKT